ncbi:MAG: nitrate/nitrite transporter [Alphaproteobacteria bacterium]
MSLAPGRIVAALCATEALGMLGFAAFPALVPDFIAAWRLSNTQAGLIAGIYFGGYMACVPVLVSLTDRVDPKKIYVWSIVVAALAQIGFALFATGFWSALVFQALAGAALAGAYMPGLKILSDNVTGPRQSRYIAFYTATFSLGSALSYFIAGEVGRVWGFAWAFATTGAVGFASAAMAAALVPTSPKPAAPAAHRLLDFRPVLRDRPTMAYVFGYAAHMWELFGLRAWLVAFLVFAQSLHPEQSPWLTAATVAALVNLIGLPCSIGGNELAMRYGRRRVLTYIMLTSAAIACTIGFLAALPFWAVTLLCLVWAMFVTGDSASLTAGAVLAIRPEIRGAAMAVHSTVGFGFGFLGSVALGIVLDLAGSTILGWGLAFATLGIGCAFGPAALWWLGRRE